MFAQPPGGIDLDQMVRMVVPRKDILALALGARRLSDLPKPPESNPREGLELADQKYLVVPGEYLRIEFTRTFRPGDLLRPVVEAYSVVFPSGHEAEKLTEGEFSDLLTQRLGVPAEQLPRIFAFAVSNRQIVFWPHEFQLRSILRLPVRPTLVGPDKLPSSPLGIVAPEESSEVFL